MTYSDERAPDPRVTQLQGELAAASAQNQRLVSTLKDARDQIVALKEEVDRLAEPPSGYGVFLELFEDGSIDVFASGRKMRVVVSPAVDATATMRPKPRPTMSPSTAAEGTSPCAGSTTPAMVIPTRSRRVPFPRKE